MQLKTKRNLLVCIIFTVLFITFWYNKIMSKPKGEKDLKFVLKMSYNGKLSRLSITSDRTQFDREVLTDKGVLTNMRNNNEGITRMYNRTLNQPRITTRTNAYKRTFLKMEEGICETRQTFQVSVNKNECPSQKIVTVRQGGRLGNQMFEYAVVLAVGRKTGLKPYVPRCIRVKLEKCFEKLSVPSLEEIAHCPVDKNTFTSLERWKSPHQGILLPMYCQYPELVLTWIDEIRREFEFKRQLQDESQNILRSYMDTYTRENGENSTNQNRTFIGVHIRRSDYAQILRRYKMSRAEPKFYLNAMNFFQTKYHHPIFVIASDDSNWCRKIFSMMSNVFITSRKNSAALDLAILSNCNHTIFDYGTYGVWAAILAGGETIYYNSTTFSSRLIADILGNWHEMQ